MSIPINTLSNLLSGNINFSSASLKAVITNGYYDQSPKYLSDLTSIVQYNQGNIQTFVQRDTAVSGSVYLSAHQTFFPNVTTDFSNNYATVCTYIDTNNPSTSLIVEASNFYSPNIYGDTYYYYYNDQILFLQDSGSNTLFRNFRKKLLNGQFGNLQNLNIKVVLMDNNYSYDINADQYLSDISNHVISTANVYGVYILDNNLCYNGHFITFTGITGTNIANDIVVYSDTGTPSNSDLICVYSSNSNTLLGVNAGHDVYFKFNSNIIIAL